jgi:uncharacterized RDD family membrane protein YckC
VSGEGGLTSGDPLGDEPRRSPQSPPSADPPRPAEPPPASAYGSDRVPPGAFAPRPREEVSDRFAGAEPAEWWRRAVAAIIDAAVVGVAAAILLGLSFAPLNLDDTSGVAGAIVVGLVAILGISIGALLYAPLIMARTDGKTLGKMATGCRVIRADGRRIDFGWAALREVVVKAIGLGVAGGMTGGIAYLVDIFWPFFDGRKRALHDIVVDSRVVRD